MKGDADDHVDVDVDTGGVCGAANQLAGSTATTVTPLNDGSSSMGTGELTVFRSNCGYMNNKKQQHQNNDALADVPSSVGGVVISTLTTTTTTVTTTIQAHPQHDHSHHHRTNDTNDDDTGEYDNLSLIHISEPTRLLSISYAVFCLKKKTLQHLSLPAPRSLYSL
eukprot:TRINITY_DN44214_c0_g1_i2.p1 TRINITY_DN44214_c0_g1~~TRINITY_DN44214_c0_g1_i2.p1  ORF type:complete len:166 (+),score=47.37 TRINITY_DN44214_c0_g1_i2:387-884(+)